MLVRVPRAPRIALVIDRFDGRRGGAALWTRGFAAWLAARQCDVHVLARDLGPVESRLPLTFHAIDAARSPLAFAAAVAARLAVIRPLLSHDMGVAIGCDIFQPHVGSGAACWEGSVASYPAWLRPVKRLCNLSPRRHRLRQMCDDQFSAGSQLFIAVSNKVAIDMRQRHRVPPERIHVVHNGVDLSRFPSHGDAELRLAMRNRLGLRDDDVALIAVAHHPRLKGLRGLMRVVRRLRSEGAQLKLLVCGGTLNAPASHPRHDGAVIDCGRVDDVAPFYAAADICVHPTFYDACSLVTLEALAAGLPVVTTRANGASELLTTGVNGVVLEVCDDDALLASALRPLIRSADLRRQMGAAGRSLAERRSVERNYAEIVAVYGSALAWRTRDALHRSPALSARGAQTIRKLVSGC